jgi:hypothetical protein
MEERLEKIEQDILAIKLRNNNVEADKAWEISLFRKILIAIITYIIASFILYIIRVQNFLLSAFIPTVGYILSTLSLPIIKKWWMDKHIKR